MNARTDIDKVRETVRRHRPTLTRKLDLGEMGEHEVEIEYDAGDDSDIRGKATFFHVTAIRLNGLDIWPAFDTETQDIYQRELKHELDYLALHPEEA